MTTLRAKDVARISLDWKKLEARSALLRGRVEAKPGAGMEGPMKSAESHIRARFMDKATEALERVTDGLEAYDRKVLDTENRQSAEAQDKDLATKGIDTLRTATGVGQRHGMLWLIEKKRLTGDRRRAAEAWSVDYAMVQQDSLRSCLNDNGRGGSDGPSQSIIEKRVAASHRLKRVRSHIVASTGSARLADLAEAVCGRGDNVRALAGGSQALADRTETELMIALDMAAVSYGILRVAA